MFVSSFIRRGWFALAMLSGCFAEISTELSSEPTTEQMCAVGSLGCECYGNGSCDAQLDCAPEVAVCVPSDCAVGSEHCVCNEGACLAALSCTAGVCIDPVTGADSGVADTGPFDDSDATGSGSSDGGPASGSSESSQGSSTDAQSSSGESDDSETGPLECAALSCGECVACVAEPAGACSSQADQCSAETGCGSAAVCLASCGVKGLCLDECCAGKTPAAVAAALALNGCRSDQCATACGDYNLGQCS